MLVLVMSAVAQTEWKENYVTLAENNQTNPSLAMPSVVDYTITVWEDTRDSGRLTTDIYAQKIDNTNGLPQWLPVDGVPVCQAPYNQHNPRAAYDTLDHVMIVWEDERCDINKPAIYAQCLNVSDGSVVTNWLINGNRVSDTTQHAERPRIVGTGDGAYIAWEDWRNWHSSDPDSLHRDIYLQFMYSATATYPQGGNYAWADGGIPVPASNSYDDRNVELDRDSYWMQAQDSKDRDGVVLSYESKREWSDMLSDSVYIVMANRFDPDGNRDWSNQDIRCADTTQEQLNPRIVVEGREHGTGDSTAVVVWQDAREHPGTPVAYHIIGQVLNKITGSLIGDQGGIDICTFDGTQQNPELSLYEESEDPGLSIPYLSRVICVWEDLREYGSRSIDVYCSVLDGTDGSIVTATGTDGEEVATVENAQDQPKVDHFPGDKDAYIVWRNRLTTYDIWYQGMDLKLLQFSQAMGSGKEVTGAKGDQVNPQVGGDVFVFADHRRQPIEYDRTEDWNIYAETPGECVGPKDMNWRDMFAEVTPYGDAGHMRFAVDHSNNTYVVWEEGTSDAAHDVYIQKIDVDGVPRWPNSGIKLNTSTAFHPEVTISDSTGGAQVVWQQSASGTDSVYYAKLSPMGSFVYRRFVCEGSKPVIDYTDTVYNSSDSKLVAPSFHANIASVNASGGVDYSWNYSGTGWTKKTFSNGYLGCTASEVQLRSALGGGLYMAIVGQSSGSPFLAAVVNQKYSAQNVRKHAYPYFYGLDIERDDNGIAELGNKNGCIVVCGGSTANTNLVSYWMKADSNKVSPPLTLVSAGANDHARYPAICPDSSLNPVTHDGGILAAWDWEYYGGVSQVHDIETNQLSSTGVNWVFSHPTPVRMLTLTDSATYPDIARLRGFIGDTAAFIVYEGTNETCSPNRPLEIYGNWVIYDSTSIHRGGRWVSPQRIGPGAGSYTQRHPMIRTSVDSSVNVYWYDARGPVDLVMGTRTWAVDSMTINWGKKVAEDRILPVASIRLGENYPNPLSLSKSCVSYVVIEASEEGTVRLELYDNLGRQAGMVYKGRLTVGQHDLQFDVSRLSPGMYHYLLRLETGMHSRGLIIVR
jgi:hypothetical protein